jgi:O-antigen/teichoic acid export membrane protein
MSGAGPESEVRRPSTTSATAYTYATNLAVAIVSFVNVLIVARYLGPTGRGDVAFLTAIATFVGALSTMGVEESNANLAGGRPELRRTLATNSLVLAFLFGGLGALCVGILVALFPAVAGSAPSDLLALTLASLGFIVLGTYLRFFIRADYGFTITNLAWLLAPCINAGVNGLFALLGVLSVATAVTTWVVGQIASTLVLVWWVAFRMDGFGAPRLGLMRQMLGFGLKSHAGRVTLLGNYRLDQWILGAVSGARELGLYSVAVAWAEALWYLPTALAAVQRADLVRVGRKRAAHLAAVGFRVATSITAVLALGMIAAAPLLCEVAFGQEFTGSIDDLRVLTLGAFGVVSLKLFGSALVAQREPVRSSAALATGFLFTIALDVLLIPPYGGLGAAVASTVAYTVAGILMAWLCVSALGGRSADLLPRSSDAAWLARTAGRLRRRPAAGDAIRKSQEV